MSNIPLNGFGVDPSGTPPPTPLSITSANVSGVLRVTFSVPVTVNPVVLWTGTYVTTPALEIKSVTPSGTPTASYVDLVTSEQKTGLVYSAQAYNIEAA